MTSQKDTEPRTKAVSTDAEEVLAAALKVVDDADLLPSLHSHDVLAAMPDYTIVRKDEIERLRAALTPENNVSKSGLHIAIPQPANEMVSDDDSPVDTTTYGEQAG